MKIFNWTISSVLILAAFGNSALSEASMCEDVHHKQILDLRPIDAFASLRDYRKQDLYNKLKISPGLRDAIIMQFNAQGLRADNHLQLAKLFQSVKDHLATDPDQISKPPFERSRVFEAAVKNVMEVNSFDLKADEKELLNLQIQSLAYELKFPFATVDHRVAKFKADQIQATLEKYPKIRELLASVDQKLETMMVGAKVTDAKQIPFFSGHKVDPKTKLDEAGTVISGAIKDVYNHMQDREAFKAYVKDLIQESAVIMDRRQDAKELALLAEGKISREAAMKVVISRFKARGVEFGVIKKTGIVNANENFRQMVLKSAMFDLGFGAGSSHGQEVHLVQVDYIYDTVYQSTHGDLRKFWDYLGSKKGIWYWYDLFDSSQSNLTRPEYFGPLIRNWVPLR